MSEKTRTRRRNFGRAAAVVIGATVVVGAPILDHYEHVVAARKANPVYDSAACATFTPSDFRTVFGETPTYVSPDGGFSDASSCSYDLRGASPALQVTVYRGAQAQAAEATLEGELTQSFDQAAPGARLAGAGGKGAQAAFLEHGMFVQFDYNLNKIHALAQAVRIAYDAVPAR